jgi:HD-GYP domain-containing protein (c-di-GMP phosphodiesterase class II)
MSPTRKDTGRGGYEGKIARTEDRARDLAELKKKDAALEHQNALLSGINQTLKKAPDCENQEQVGEMCLSVAEDITGSSFGFIDELISGGRFKTVAISDPGWKACSIPDPRDAIMDKDHPLRGICGLVVSEEQSMIFNDPAAHPAWSGLPEGHPMIHSFLGVPFKRGEKATGLIALANKPSGYTQADKETVEALGEVFWESIARKRKDRELIETIALLRKAMGGTIEAVSAMMETRDPYTSGHQSRVSDMAMSMATEMGLDADAIEGIRLAASIHDLGKIAVPAEILSKPTSLSENEFGMIKEL